MLRTLLLLGVAIWPIQSTAATSMQTAGEGSAAATLPSSEEVRALLAKRVDADKRDVGLVVGLLSPQARTPQVIGYGRARKDGAVPDGETIFEIGSINKVFTTLLLADMVRKGEVSLDDPVSKYIPANVKMPTSDRPITLLDLATHTSGLPVVPSNMAPKAMKDPYADYTVEQLFAYLPDAKLNGPVGKKYEYSNTGLGLLGQALARRAGTDYDSLLRTRVLQPLGLSDTSAGAELEKDKRAAVGHDAALEPVPNWHLQAIAPAGGLRSNVNDLLTFLAAHMEKNATPLSASAALATEHRRPTDTKHVLALGWHVATAPNGQEIVWHNGGTAGFRSFMGFDPKKKAGVVILSNTGSTPAGVTDLGMQILTGIAPNAGPPIAQVDTATLDKYVGTYPFNSAVSIAVTRTDNQLFVQMTGQPRLSLKTVSATEFSVEGVPATIRFETAVNGDVTLLLDQNGMVQRVKRSSR